MTIQDSVIALWKAGAKRIKLDEIKARPGIGVKIGESPIDLEADNSVSNERKAVIVVFSKVVINEDSGEFGEFEAPEGWPATTNYPSGTPVPDPLPGSLLNNSGTLSLDANVAFLTDKRVHLIVYQKGTVLEEESVLVPIGLPFSGYYQGVASSSSWTPKLFMHAANGLSTDASARKAALLAQGVTLVTMS